MVYKAFWDTFLFDSLPQCSFKWHRKSVPRHPAVIGRTSLHLIQPYCGVWIGVLWFSIVCCGGLLSCGVCGGLQFSGGPVHKDQPKFNRVHYGYQWQSLLVVSIYWTVSAYSVVLIFTHSNDINLTEYASYICHYRTSGWSCWWWLQQYPTQDLLQW